MLRYVRFILITILTFYIGYVIAVNLRRDEQGLRDTAASIELLAPVPAKINYSKPDGDSNKTSAENLDTYLAGREIQPYITINNISGEQKKIRIGNHIIKWIGNEKIKLKINNDLFTVDTYKTLNIVWAAIDDVTYFNNWNQIVLYKINGRELIAIKLQHDMCNGLGCAVSYYLMYDVETMSKNFFGLYCNDGGLKLYNFNGVEEIDYLSKTFAGDRCGSPNQKTEYLYNLFTLNEKGSFTLRKDSEKNPFFIRQVFWQNEDKMDGAIFEQHWIEKIE